MKHLFLVLLLVLAGCTTNVDLPEPAHTPRIALRYSLSTVAPNQQTAGEQTFNQLYVSYSQRMFDTKPLIGRTDAVVEVRDAAGTVVERFKPAQPSSNPPASGFRGYRYERGYYLPTLNFAGQPGSTYTLRANLPGFEPVESTLTLPALPQLESATFTRRQPDPNRPDIFRGRLALTLQDPAATADYYVVAAHLVIDVGSSSGNRSVMLYNDDENTTDFGSVSVFKLSNLNDYYGGLAPYPDTNVNGQRFTLSTNVVSSYECSSGNQCAPKAVEVKVLSLTEDAYKFYQSRRRYNDSEGNPFAEPAPLFSNIRGGYGFFGGSSVVTYQIAL